MPDNKQENKKKVLLFGGGGCHDYKICCPLLESYLRQAGGFVVDYVAEDKDVFLAQRIAGYDLAVIYHTGGELTVEQKHGLTEWVASGKGFAGVHAAADSFHNAPEYLAMVGGVFRAHPFTREYIVGLNDTTHAVTKNIKGYVVKDWEKWPVFEYKVTDEQYLLDYDSRVHVLASALFRGRLWPVAWVKSWGKGKVFYLALGHDIEACRNPFFRDMFLGGVAWAADTTPYQETPATSFAIA